MIFYIVHYYLGWVPGRSFHSLSWLIDFVRIDVYNCLRLLFCAGGNLFLGKDWLIIIILGFPLSFFPPPVKPRLESFQLKHSVSQSHIFPLALKVTRCLHSIRKLAPIAGGGKQRMCELRISSSSFCRQHIAFAKGLSQKQDNWSPSVSLMAWALPSQPLCSLP